MLAPRRNEALEINPPGGDQHLTTNGSDWLWAVTAVFVVSTVSIHALRIWERGEGSWTWS